MGRVHGNGDQGRRSGSENLPEWNEQSVRGVEQAEYAFLNAIVESQMLFSSSESLRKAITEKRVVKDTALEAMMVKPKPEGEKAHKKAAEDEA